MVEVQSQIGPASKGKTNPFFKSNYARLEDVWEACRGALHANGIAVIQGSQVIDGKACMETKLVHTSGQWFSSLWEMMPAKEDPQSMGSAITYMRRYSLSAMVGILAADDDGNAASRKPSATHADLTPAADQRMADNIGKVMKKPAIIVVPNLNDEKANWKQWGNDMVHALGTSSTPDIVDQWISKNGVPLGNLNRFSKSAYDHIQAQAVLKKSQLNVGAG
jgi:hypothetical protein